MNEINPNVQLPPDAEVQPAPAPDAPEAAPAETAEHFSLVWHGFLTRFYLWLAALFHLAQAALFCTGLLYRDIAIRDVVYAGLPQMQWLDLGTGSLMALGALLQVIACFRLLGRKKHAGRLLCAAYGALLIGQVGYGALRFAFTQLSPLSNSIVGLTAVYLALLAVNARYYARRRPIFQG